MQILQLLQKTIGIYPERKHNNYKPRSWTARISAHTAAKVQLRL